MTKVIRNSRGTELDMQKCVENAGSNRFNLVLIASTRAREILRNSISSRDAQYTNPVVTALEEVQSGKIGPEYLQKIKQTTLAQWIEHQPTKLMVEGLIPSGGTNQEGGAQWRATSLENQADTQVGSGVRFLRFPPKQSYSVTRVDCYRVLQYSVVVFKEGWMSG